MRTDTEKTLVEINKEFYGEHFNDNTTEYLKYSAGAKYFNYLLTSILKNIDKRLVSTVADVGCGVGHKTLTLKQNIPNANVIGFDFSRAAIEAAKKAYGGFGVNYSAEDITKKTYKKKYDLISAFDILEHIDDWEDMLIKLINVNKKYLLISVSTGRMRPYEKSIGHYRNFKRGQIEDFLQLNGYETVDTYYAGFPFFSPILRDLTQVFQKHYSETISVKMSSTGIIMHKIWYVLFKYFSTKKRKGELFVGLFEKK